jgi:hypothetical protein
MAGERKLSITSQVPSRTAMIKEKTEWRKGIKSRVSKLEYKCIDPTDHSGCTPFKETGELDRSDLAVVANLWRESAGTVIGIVQARRKGKPVILIDPN